MYLCNGISAADLITDWEIYESMFDRNISFRKKFYKSKWSLFYESIGDVNMLTY